ncbi:MAG: hypothetical protein KatS3mg105_2739 [Gemmatales bacterium]|nr:MAG: hypothetical protein KatS3mg105_2739 [Gemmatales bacterium]
MKTAKKRVLWLLGTSALLLTIVWIAPILIGHSPLRNNIAKYFFNSIQGTIEVEDASLGWFSTVQLHNVCFRDRQGQPVLSVPYVESEKTLLAILLDSSDLGRFFVDRPRLEVHIRATSSNIEEVFHAWIHPHERIADQSQLAVALVVKDGTIVLRDPENNDVAEVEDVHVDLHLAGLATETSLLKAEGKLAGAHYPPSDKDTSKGTLRFELSADETVRCRLEFAELPAHLVELVAKKFDIDAKCSGALSGSVQCSHEDEAVTIEGRINGRSIRLESSHLAPDVFVLNQLEVPFRLSKRGAALHLKETRIACDIGNIELDASIPCEKSLLSIVDKFRGRLQGDVDLAVLAKKLPNTLRLHKDLNITSGKLSATLQCDAQNGLPCWSGSMHAHDLEASVGNQAIHWSNPIAAEFVARREATGVVVDSLRCQTDFLNIRANGSFDRLALAATFDLDHMMASVSRFVDLGDLRCSGQGEVELDVARKANGDFTCKGFADFRRLDLTGTNLGSLLKDHVRLALEASGRSTDEWRCERARLSCRLDPAAGQGATSDQSAIDIQCELLEPIADLFSTKTVVCTVSASGDLSAFQRRFEPWLGGLAHAQIKGLTQANAIARLSKDRITIIDSKAGIRQLVLETSALAISEPNAQVRLSGSWTPDQSRLELQDVLLKFAETEISAPRLRFDLNGPIKLAGQARIRGPLQKLQRCFPQLTSPNLSLGGDLLAQCHLRWHEHGLQFDTDTAIDHFRWTNHVGTNWQEKQLHLLCNGHYDPERDVLIVRSLQARSQLLGISVHGQVHKPTSLCQLDLKGNLEYDLVRLNGFFREVLGDGVKLAGRDVRPCEVSGSLAPWLSGPMPASSVGVSLGKPVPLTANQTHRPSTVPLRAYTSIAVQSAEVFGFKFDSFVVDARLADGWITVQPVKSRVNEGTLLLVPSYHLHPPEWHWARGLICQNIRITPAMCASALGYVSPILANAFETQGRISIATDGGFIPLNDVKQGRFKGQLIIHELQIRSSPLLNALGSLFDWPGQADLKHDLIVPFEFVNGRVYHRDFIIPFRNVTLRTYGSVGVDGSLALVVEMPIPKKFLPTDRLQEVLAKTTIKVPVTGSLNQPRLDRDFIRREAAKVIRESTRNLLRDEAGRQLDRLLRPFRP